MRTYLSIDLDFWCKHNDAWHAERFFKRVWALNLRICVALHHHHLLRHINRQKKLDAVVNVDFHSDIIEDHEGFPEFELNEGTWANFVKHQERMTFEWRYPEKECLADDIGYCHQFLNPFEEDCTYWQRVKKREGVARIPWGDICAVGVCLSPFWLGNKWAVSYPIECLGLHDWLGRWLVYDGFKAPEDSNAENGEGIFKPRLTYPKHEV